jgi:hypothetical protein
MQFDNSIFTFLAILLHSALSLTSLIFKIPDYRVQSGPMIYPEFRLHSIVFAMRSLVVMLLMYVSRKFDIVLPLYFRGFVVLLTMHLADRITKSYKAQGTTMRGMPFPEYIPEAYREHLNTFYSVSQLFATAQMMFAYRLDEVFLILYPIQIAAFLMTCVRKSIISAGAWHFYYALALGLNYVCGPILELRASVPTPTGVFFPVAFASIFLRFNCPKVNKYIIWGSIAVINLIAMYYYGMYTTVIV